MGRTSLVYYAAAGALALTATQAAARDDLYCAFKSQTHCDAGGCRALPVDGLHAFVAPEYGRYTRCTTETDCDTINYALHIKSDYVRLDAPETGVRIEIRDSTSIVETLSNGRRVLVSFGTCEPGPPPIVLKPIQK